MTLPDYRKDKNISPCPRCNGEVEWTNTRDLNMLDNFMMCSDCDLMTFSIKEPMLTPFLKLPNLDYQTTVMKYNAWCATNPKVYDDEEW